MGCWIVDDSFWLCEARCESHEQYFMTACIQISGAFSWRTLGFLFHPIAFRNDNFQIQEILSIWKATKTTVGPVQTLGCSTASHRLHHKSPPDVHLESTKESAFNISLEVVGVTCRKRSWGEFGSLHEGWLMESCWGNFEWVCLHALIVCCIHSIQTYKGVGKHNLISIYTYLIFTIRSWKLHSCITCIYKYTQSQSVQVLLLLTLEVKIWMSNKKECTNHSAGSGAFEKPRMLQCLVFSLGFMQDSC